MPQTAHNSPIRDPTTRKDTRPMIPFWKSVKFFDQKRLCNKTKMSQMIPPRIDITIGIVGFLSLMVNYSLSLGHLVVLVVMRVYHFFCDFNCYFFISWCLEKKGRFQHTSSTRLQISSPHHFARRHAIWTMVSSD